MEHGNVSSMGSDDKVQSENQDSGLRNFRMFNDRILCYKCLYPLEGFVNS